MQASKTVDTITRMKTLGGDAITDAPLTTEHAEALARTMHALADRTRVLIVSALLHAPGRELHGRDLQEQLSLRQPTASHHLRKLVRAGILVREQRGPYGYYRVAPGALEDLCRLLGGASA
jgi:ArsR family transcriptional regulator, arsenate/arsenite/antimonite-responsive transcriptional repressor